VSDTVSRGQQAADEVARRWIATMQSVADQIQRQQQTLQQMMQDQMSSYVQLLNNPPFYMSQQPQEEGQTATGQTFHQASDQWMQLAQNSSRLSSRCPNSGWSRLRPNSRPSRRWFSSLWERTRIYSILASRPLLFVKVRVETC
jgi:hypothetical protein